MWINSPVYEHYYTLNKNGKQIKNKRVVTNPSDIESWFYFASTNNFNMLKLMLNKNFDVNTLSPEDNNIGFLGVEKKSFKLLKFFLDNNGDVSYLGSYPDLTLGVYRHKTLLNISSYSFSPLRFFKAILLHHIQHNIELRDIDELCSILVSNEKNIGKIRLLLKYYPNNQQIKNLLLKYIENRNSKIYFLVSGKEKLYYSLKKSKNSFTNIKNKRFKV